MTALIKVEDRLIEALDGSDTFVLGDPYKSEYMHELLKIIRHEKIDLLTELLKAEIVKPEYHNLVAMKITEIRAGL